MIGTARIAVMSALACFALVSVGCERTPQENSSAPAAVAADPDVPQFTDVLSETGITFSHHFIDSETGTTFKVNPYDHGCGVAVADVNGDGLEDIYFIDLLGPNALYLNRGGLKFEDVTAQAGVAVERALHVGAAFGDFDNDGDQDLYATTYRGGNHLFRNRGDGTFEEITATAGVGYIGHSNSCTWLDYDLDGDLDLYLSNIGKFTTETIADEADYFYTGVNLPYMQIAAQPQKRVLGERDILYRNEGDGTFSDVSAAAGINAAEWNGSVAIADIDGDGDSDIYVSNMFGENRLYRNRGDGTFEDVATALLKRTSWGGMGARFFDANNDAFPDLYVVDMHSDMWIESNMPGAVVADGKFNGPLGPMVQGGHVITAPEQSITRTTLFGNTFFVNQGGTGFVERSQPAGLENWWPWGICSGDFNNDGTEDIFVPAGMGYPYFYWPNYFYLNVGDGTFVERASVAGIEPPRGGLTYTDKLTHGRAMHRSSRAAVSADFDLDGDLDLLVNNFNHEPYFFRNDSPPASWVRLRLRGTKASRDAVGARIRVTGGGRTWHRWVSNAEGYLSQSSSIVHVGLGALQTIDSIEVLWPGQAEPQAVPAPQINTLIDVVQQ